jgi:hypothetical protein
VDDGSRDSLVIQQKVIEGYPSRTVWVLSGPLKRRASGPKGRMILLGAKERVREPGFASLVPQGRLNLAQDASPGYIVQYD